MSTSATPTQSPSAEGRPPPEPGDAAPWFIAPAIGGSEAYRFHTVAGRFVLLLFFGSAEREDARQALAAVQANRSLFDDSNACFFGVTVDPEDAAAARVVQQVPGIRYFLDRDRSVSAGYGASAGADYRPYWLLLDRTLRVVDRFPVEASELAMQALRGLLAEEVQESWAPVLVVPNVFEPDLCQALVRLYETQGGAPSGFMQERDGKTVVVEDVNVKQRRDHVIEDEQLRNRLGEKIGRRLRPMVRRAFQFDPTRIERYLVACYEAGAGHFRAHRDNTTKGTAHRQFAVTINLNAGEYEGGELRFPEFGARRYVAPTGGAIVFSCSLLHEVMPVTAGRRYAFLPFLYNEAGARIREANNVHLGAGTAQYRMG